MATAAADILHSTPNRHCAPPLLLGGGLTIGNDVSHNGKQATDYLLGSCI
jgi:hypothetical protein